MPPLKSKLNACENYFCYFKKEFIRCWLNSSNQKIDRSNNFIPERTQIMRWLNQDLGWHTRRLLCQDHEVPFIQMDDRA